MSDTINKKVVALKYDKDKSAAPVVVAKGKGYLAERILKVAEENEVPSKEDKDLINYLMSLDLHEEIPPELYKVVSEILTFVYKANEDYKEVIKVKSKKKD